MYKFCSLGFIGYISYIEMAVAQSMGHGLGTVGLVQDLLGPLYTKCGLVAGELSFHPLNKVLPSIFKGNLLTFSPLH